MVVLVARDGIERIEADPEQIALARIDSSDPTTAVAGSTVEDARAAFAVMRPLSRDQIAEGARLWRLFASPSPIGFDHARRNEAHTFPELTESGDVHGAWFPRLTGDRLELAELDELLLRQFDDTWRTTWTVLAEIQDLRRSILPFGHTFAVCRLLAWAMRGVLSHEARSDENPFKQDAFRANDRSRMLLASGMHEVDDAPPLFVGSCAINLRDAPWVRVGDPSGWRIALQQ